MTPKRRLAATDQIAKARSLIVFLALTIMAAPAFAQITKVQSTLDKVVAVLIGAGVAIFTIAILWVGYKMAFMHAKWVEVSNIVIGGSMAGGAAGIAVWLFS